MGSGNAGFTNVLRSVGKGPAVFTIVFDFVKGILAVIIGGILFSTILRAVIFSRENFLAMANILLGFAV